MRYSGVTAGREKGRGEVPPILHEFVSTHYWLLAESQLHFLLDVRTHPVSASWPLGRAG